MSGGITIREYKATDPSFVFYMQMRLYEREYGFKSVFEYYLLKAMTEFVNDPTGGNMWVAEENGQIVGSVALVKSDELTSQLRWFAVDERVQGYGIGTKLLDAALAFSDKAGYKNVVLWTVDVLKTARHMYAKRGFVLTDTKENIEWTDKVLTEEKWERKID